MNRLHLGIIFFGVAWLAANIMDIHDMLEPNRTSARQTAGGARHLT